MEKEKAVCAKKEFFFRSAACPVAVRFVAPSAVAVHGHDLTDKMHFHDFAELVMILEGEALQIINEVAYPVSAGDVFVIQGQTTHSFVGRGSVSMVNIMFAKEHIPLPFDRMRELAGYNVLFELEPSLRTPENFRHRLHLGPAALAQGEALVRALDQALGEAPDVLVFFQLWSLILFLSRQSETRPASGELMEYIAKVISLMERKFSRNLSLGDLARSAAVSPNTLLRNFQKVTGKTPMEALCQIRLSHAEKLLLTTDLPVGTISVRCGFPDSNYFSRKFRSRYQLPPREFRRRGRIW
ncbi:MAG: helix-turn-helix domain-containing protein [Victivallaceae bacterium]|nr:helix-turn-helix domain-containing protein [Victivallaceae bacterium]